MSASRNSRFSRDSDRRTDITGNEGVTNKSMIYDDVLLSLNVEPQTKYKPLFTLLVHSDLKLMPENARLCEELWVEPSWSDRQVTKQQDHSNWRAPASDEEFSCTSATGYIFAVLSHNAMEAARYYSAIDLHIDLVTDVPHCPAEV